MHSFQAPPCTLCLTLFVHYTHIAVMALEEWLASQNIKPSVFARRLGLSHTTVLRWIQASSTPSATAIHAVFEATGGAVTANDLLRQSTPA